MADQDLSKEEQILRIMKKVLTEIAKETYTRPGLRHPLSDNTIQGIRDCLVLISSREMELAESAGKHNKLRPRFADEPQTSVVVPIITSNNKKNKEDSKDQD